MSDLLNIDNVYSSCFNPVRIMLYDNIEQREVIRELPCGKCYHCRITKINEWVTRMVLQSLYSKYVYFGTLTYAVTKTKHFDETLPLISSINKEGKLLPTPVVLVKPHLQKFFKRLRKNTGIKFQYFACGEYGTKFGRPHFHYIMWSDTEITENQISDSWSELGVSLGRVEHQDLRKDAKNIEHSYKYVCKYVQKSSFNYDKLPTKQLHEIHINEGLQPGADYKAEYYETKKDYLKKYSPFVLCSKRPAIGYSYFSDNVIEFQKGDFRLFGVKGDYIFPTYYYRKTRESLCPYKTISEKNGKPNSYSSIPQVVSLLVELQNAIAFNEGFLSNTPIVRCYSGRNVFEFPSRRDTNQPGGRRLVVPAEYFNFYDAKNRLYYYIRGDGDYLVCRGHQELYTIPASVLIKELQSSYNRLLESFALSIHERSKFRDKDKHDKIISEFGDYNTYLSERKKVIENILSIVDRRQNNYELTKIDF